MTSHIDIGSFLRGIQVMDWPQLLLMAILCGDSINLRLHHKEKKSKVKYAIRFKREWWCYLWTPIWHKGRGPYVSIGLGFIAFHRGY